MTPQRGSTKVQHRRAIRNNRYNAKVKNRAREQTRRAKQAKKEA